MKLSKSTKYTMSLVSNNGAHATDIFCDEQDFERFINLLYIANSTAPIALSRLKRNEIYNMPRLRPPVSIIAYCLLPNSYQMILSENEPGGIHRFVHKCSTAYSMYFNAKYHHRGTLFESNCRIKKIDNNRRVRELIREIHLKPFVGNGQKIVKSKNSDLVAAIDYSSVYAYSSMRDYLGEDRNENAIVTPLAADELSHL
ncbi:MAG: hypothetical protein KGJ35_03550 [Patescibacteria group bacterium]|nr:hypothetical protein [Patescibacteria group bacterium]